MIPFLLPVANILVLQYIRLTNTHGAVPPRNNIVDQVIMNFMHLCMDYIHLVHLVSTYVGKTTSNRWYKPHLLLKLMLAYRSRNLHRDVWLNMQNNWDDFYWLTGETPISLQVLVNQVQARHFINHNLGRRCSLNVRNQILLTLIWLRRYPSMNHLAMQFEISVSTVHKIIHKILPILHAYLVPNYITWPTMNEWNNMAGSNPHWPRVVGSLDCTIFRISRPTGHIQRMYYRGDRKCHFLNWLVICDNNQQIVFSRPGFLGHAHDNTCLRLTNLPPFPPNLQIMADPGFEYNLPVIVLPRPNNQFLPDIMRKTFRAHRSMIERCFGILKNSYSGAGTRRFRSRRWHGPIVCNISAAMYNRRRLLFKRLRFRFGVN